MKEKDESNDDELEKDDNMNRELTLTLPKWLYCYTPVVVGVVTALLSVAVSSHWQSNSVIIRQKNTAQAVGVVAGELFAHLDKDGDSLLSLEEAGPLLVKFLDLSEGDPGDLTADLDLNDEVITIKAELSPLNVSTMTKDFENDPSNMSPFQGLFQWIRPHCPSRQFRAARFTDLLPRDMDHLTDPGTVYSLLNSPVGHPRAPHLSSNHYLPPRAAGREAVLQRLLAMFHPNVFLTMRFPPQGAIACVRAVSDTHVAVVIRVHAEFQLNTPPLLPFWFTPAQLTGQLVMRRDGGRVEWLEMELPADRRLNVDMEWLTDKADPEAMEVDIGHCPLMRLVSTGPSRGQGAGEDQGAKNFSRTDVQWDKEISLEEAKHMLEVKYFPFKEIPYHNVSSAFTLAQAQDKLVHSVLLWGALDDQSC